MLLIINQPSLAQPETGKPRRALGREQQLLMISPCPCRGGSWECGDCAVPKAVTLPGRLSGLKVHTLGIPEYLGCLKSHTPKILQI